MALLRWADRDRGKAKELGEVIARLDLDEVERDRILGDLSDLREAAGEFVTAVSDADLRAAYERSPQIRIARRSGRR